MNGSIPPEYLNQIVTGDARELAKRIPDESIDLIFTDPPYPREYLHCFQWLAIESSRILKPGGLLITLSGHPYLDKIIEYFSGFLDFYWIGGMPNTLGSIGRVHPKQMLCGWKPVLWYSKGQIENHPYIFDFFKCNADKRYHEWGQPSNWFMYYIEKLTPLNSKVFDPFCGGGTVPAVCKMLGRNYIAFEIDPDVAERARERVRNTQPPLFVLQPEQIEMDMK